MTYPTLSQIRLGYQILGHQHHLPSNQISQRLAQQTQLSPQEREAAASSLIWLASLVDGGNLGREDFQLALNQQSTLRDRHDPQFDAALEAALREGLGFPLVDPQGIHLRFRSTEREGSHYSWVSIIPQEIDANKPVLVFVTGLHHPSPIYLSYLMELARREHRVIYSVDLPSMGGSTLEDDASVYASGLREAVLSCIQEETLLGQHFDLMGHSLGTVPARVIEAEARANPERNFQGRILNRVVLVAPVPSQEDRELGYQIRSSFTWSAIGSLLAYGAIDPTRVNELFVQNHSASEQEWLGRVVGRQSFTSSLSGTLSVFLNNYRHPFAGRLGKDHHLRVVLPGEDRLIQVQNPESWRGHRGILWVEGADHSFIGGQNVNSEYVEVLRRALNEDLDQTQEPFSRSSAFRRFRSSSFAALSFDSRGSVGGQVYLGERFGLSVFGPFGLDVEMGVQNFVGGTPGNSAPQASNYERERHFIWQPQLNLNMGLSLLHSLPLRLIAGGYFEVDATTSIHQEGLYGQTGVLAGFEVNFENTLLLRAQYQQGLWDAQGRTLPDLGAFWINIGGHLF